MLWKKKGKKVIPMPSQQIMLLRQRQGNPDSRTVSLSSLLLSPGCPGCGRLLLWEGEDQSMRLNHTFLLVLLKWYISNCSRLQCNLVPRPLLRGYGCY